MQKITSCQRNYDKDYPWPLPWGFFSINIYIFLLLLTSIPCLLACFALLFTTSAPEPPPPAPFLAGKRMSMQLTLFWRAQTCNHLYSIACSISGEHSGILLCNQFDFWKLSNFSADTISREGCEGVSVNGRIQKGGWCLWIYTVIRASGAPSTANYCFSNQNNILVPAMNYTRPN